MTSEWRCVLCGDVLPALDGGTDTRLAVLDGVSFGACAKHFPPDGSSDADYQAAYERFLSAAVTQLESGVSQTP